MKPIFLEPVYKDYIWGGKKLNKLYNKGVNAESIAESWEFSNNDKGINKIKSQNEYLSNLYNDKKRKTRIFGTSCKKLKKIPILIKLIDAEKCLSVQVHPDTKCEEKFGDSEKSEAWYILECKKGAQIICGVKNKNKFIKNIKSEKNLENLNYINIKKGDVVYIKSGMVHALTEGTIVYEIQQNSNSTYRLYDWNRNDSNRKLDIEKGIEAIRDKKVKIKHENEKCDFQTLLHTKYFSLEKLKVNGVKKQRSKVTSFMVYTIIEGKGKIVYKKEEYMLQKGDTVLIPSCLGNFYIQGKIDILRAYITKR